MGKAEKRARKKYNAAQARAERDRQAKRQRTFKAVRNAVIAAVAVIVIVIVVSAVSNGKSKKKSSTSTVAARTTTTTSLPAGCSSSKLAKSGNGKTYSKPPGLVIDPTKKYTATISTSCGDIVVDLDVKGSPKGVNNFVFLARDGFYNGLKWHRVAKDFVIQGGDPKGDGSGGPGYNLVTETPANGYELGTLAWAKTQTDPAGTAGSQFFIVTGQNGTTLPHDYGAFGKVVKGLDNAKKIESLSTGDGPPTSPMYILAVKITES